MENIIEVTTRALQGPLLERLSLQTHESEGAIRKGMEQAVPISIAGLAAHASSEGNAERLLGALRAGNYPHADAAAIGQTTTSPEATSRLVQSGSTFLRGIMGPNRHDTAVDTIAGSSGVSKATAMTLLGLSAPVVLHAVGKEADERHLDAHGLSEYLAEQGKSATTGMPGAISNLFGETRGGVQRVEQRTKSSINEARERLRATIDERQHRGGAPVAEPHRRRFGAWIAIALAVLAAILLIGRRNVPRPEGAIEAGKRTGEQVTRGGDEAQQAAQPGTPPEQQPQQAQPQQPAQPQPAQPQQAQPQQAAEQPAPPEQAQQQQGQGQEGQQAQEPATQEAAPGGVPAPATLSAVGGAGALGTFLNGTEPTPKRFVLEGLEFAPDSSGVNENAMLDAVAAQLNMYPNARIRIDGYTDATGTSAGNADLSDARANAVKRYLAARGVSESRMSAQGRAAEEPVATNDTTQGRAQNRRVELVVTSR